MDTEQREDYNYTKTTNALVDYLGDSDCKLEGLNLTYGLNPRCPPNAIFVWYMLCSILVNGSDCCSQAKGTNAIQSLFVS
jgi:hypothetical protein